MTTARIGSIMGKRLVYAYGPQAGRMWGTVDSWIGKRNAERVWIRGRGGHMRIERVSVVRHWLQVGYLKMQRK